MRVISVLLLSLLIVTACSNPRASLGLRKNAPDEFKVVKNAPLEIPTNLTSLPPPRPGAPRPQETAIPKQAQQALLGVEDSTSRSEISQTEALLLHKAGTDQANQNIRTVLANPDDASKEQTQSVAKRLLGIGDNDEEANVLNAKEEAARLQKMKSLNE